MNNIKDLEKDILNERNYTFGFVATFNADPYCVETEEEMEEVKDVVREYGIEEVTDELEREDALAKLDAENYNGPVYKAGDLLFITNK